MQYRASADLDLARAIQHTASVYSDKLSDRVQGGVCKCRRRSTALGLFIVQYLILILPWATCNVQLYMYGGRGMT